MQRSVLSIDLIEPNEGQIEGLPKNPRYIRDEKFEALKRSIEEDPEMLELREVMVYPYNGKYVAIGGNMRLAALRDLGYKDVLCKIIPENTDVRKLRAYTIKDNNGFGEWHWDMLLEDDWDLSELEDWGMDVDFLASDEGETNVDDLFIPATEEEKKKDIKIEVVIPSDMENLKEEVMETIKNAVSAFDGVKIR